MRGDKKFASVTRINSGMRLRRLALQLACAVVFIACPGCTSSLHRWASRGWVADYDTAEQRIRESGRELLICYRDTRRNAIHSAEEAFKNRRAKPHHARFAQGDRAVDQALIGLFARDEGGVGLDPVVDQPLLCSLPLRGSHLAKLGPPRCEMFARQVRKVVPEQFIVREHELRAGNSKRRFALDLLRVQLLDPSQNWAGREVMRPGVRSGVVGRNRGQALRRMFHANLPILHYPF